MSQTKTSKERKTKAPAMVNNGLPFHKTTTVQKVVKENKTDAKTEHGKQSDKFQPTAEQMRIAQIIDTKSEDPSFKDKLKQVMDAAQASVDEAFTALHDSDNDPNRAVNLLLERGNKPDEWSTSSKKKKARSPNEKKETPNPEASTAAETEDWMNPQTNRIAKPLEPQRGMNKNRPFKGARGKGGAPIENDKPKKNRAEMNGPSRGGKSYRGGRQTGRGGFGRNRPGFRRTFDTWNADPDSQPSGNVFNQMKPLEPQRGMNKNRPFKGGVEDWDSEEYTGSLANSQVFTPSAPMEPTMLHGTTTESSFPANPDETVERLPDRTQLPAPECMAATITPPQILSHYALQQQRTLQSSPPSVNKTNVGIPEAILLENKGVSHSLSNPSETQNSMSQVTALISKNEYIYTNVGRNRSLGLMSNFQPSEDVRIQRINSTKTKPRVPPPSKIPSSAVEMPPDADSAIGLLDVQFGALEFGENSSEAVHVSPPSSRHSTPSPQPTETIVPAGIPATESILSNDSRSFSPPGTGANSLASQITIEPAKIPESTSSSLYQDNVYQPSSLYTKPTQHSQNIYSQEYNSSHSQRQTGQIITSNNIIYSTSSNTLSTYASSSTGSYGTSSTYPNYQYPTNNPYISQPTTIPTSSSNNSYQVTVSAQPYSTNSQSVYGTSSLGGSSYNNSSYQGYTQLNHKSLSSSASNNKEIPEHVLDVDSDPNGYQLEEPYSQNPSYNPSFGAQEGTGDWIPEHVLDVDSDRNDYPLEEANSQNPSCNPSFGAQEGTRDWILVINIVRDNPLEEPNSHDIVHDNPLEEPNFHNASCNPSFGAQEGRGDGVQMPEPVLVVDSGRNDYPLEGPSSLNTSCCARNYYPLDGPPSQIASCNPSFNAQEERGNLVQMPEPVLVVDSARNDYPLEGPSSLNTSCCARNYYPLDGPTSQIASCNPSFNAQEGRGNWFDSSTPSVNLNSLTHSSSVTGANNTLLSSTQATPVSKPSSASTMAKGAVVASMPPGVPGLVGTHQYIVGQGGVPYFTQQPHMYYEDLQLMPQQRLPHHIATGYYEMGYQPTTTREGVQYNMSDGRFARADNTSPVQVSSMNQQSGTQGHQQPLMNPTAMPPAYAYFYGGSMIPGNFQFGAPTIYPVAATGSSTGHGSSSSGVYGKPSYYGGNSSGMYDSQSNVAEYKSSSTPGPKSQSTTVVNVNPSTSSDIPIMYSKSHSALSKVGSYDKGFHCPTPPPFNLSSQNSGIAPAGGYPPHLFIPTITPHHNTTLMHQPIHQENTNTVNSRSTINNNPNKNPAKSNYTSSNYWPGN